MHNLCVINARFVGADFSVCTVICGGTNFVVRNSVCLAGKKQVETRNECYCAFNKLNTAENKSQ